MIAPRSPYIVVRSGTSEVLGAHYFWDYEDAVGRAAFHSGVVAVASWYEKKYGKTPLAGLKAWSSASLGKVAA